MDNNDIYRVDRDEYVGFLSSIKPTARLTETIKDNGYTFIKTRSNTTDVHFCTRIVPPNESDENEQYYIFNMPNEDERQPEQPRVKIRLETQEEVQIFFDVLKKLQERG